MKTLHVLSIVALAFAMSSATHATNWSLRKSTIDAGGGISAGAGFAVRGTIGQPDSGVASGGQFRVKGGFWNGIQVVQLADGPVLKIKLVGTNAILSWPIAAEGYELEQSNSLDAPSWSDVPQPIVKVAGEQTVTVPPTGTTRIFRLKKQD